MLATAINIGPLNIFIYTWRFLKTLQDDQHGVLKVALKYFRIISILLVPIGYWALYISMSLVEAQINDWAAENISSAQTIHYGALLVNLQKVLGYWSTFTNLIACSIMALVIRNVSQLTTSPTENFDSLTCSYSLKMRQKIKMNVLVTFIHIVLILAYTLIGFLGDNVWIKGQIDQ